MLGETMRDLVFVDVETTGLNLASSIVEVAVYRRLYQKLDGMKAWKVMPPENCYVEQAALDINGFNREQWTRQGAVPFELMSKDLTECLDNVIVAGWNVKFDLGMLENEYRRTGVEKMPWHYHSFDVAALMMPLYFRGKVDSLSLRAACDYFGVSNEGAHGAAADVMRTVEVHYHLNKLYGV